MRASQQRTLETLAIVQRMTGPRQVICRPRASNIPQAIDGAELVTCPLCGAACWKLDAEPDELPENVTAACTVCAVKQSVRRR